MIDIEFTDSFAQPETKRCPVCRAKNGKPLLCVRDQDSHTPELNMCTCETCGTGYFVNDDPVRGYDHEEFSQDYWFSYVQNGAGISAMLEPLLAIDRPRSARLLDVGCGFGFVQHFWQECGFGEAIGLETSLYGRLGADKLGVKIIPSYYDAAEELRGQKFDYVFSSEVIEHVEDPEAFVNEISAALSDDGILVLTTPSASVLTKETPYLLLLASLSPGFHYFLVSANGLEDVLKKCGFEHVEVRDYGHRLFAWASHTPLPDIVDGFADWPLNLDYLEKLSQVDDPHVASGALYRALKDSINLGEFERAKALYPRFHVVARDHFGIDFDDISASQSWRRQRVAPDNEHYPSWMGCGILYAGLSQKLLGASPAKLEPLFAAAIETMQDEIELAPRGAGEPALFITRAKEEHASALSERQENALQALDPCQSYVLRYPKELADQDVCLMAIYAPQGDVNSATATYINLMCEQGFKVVLCIALEDATTKVDVTNLSNAAGIIIRENGGMDFSAWACTLRLLPECWEANRLVFTNDSVFLLADMLPGFLERLRNTPTDFVAATESFQIRYHAQSYFFMLQNAALSNPGVIAFWNDLQMLEDKQDIIEQYETRLFHHLVDELQLTGEVLFPLTNLFPRSEHDEYECLNVTHSYWEHLVGCGLPFVKVELIRDNPLKTSILNWPVVLERHGVDIQDILSHISDRKAENSKKASQKKLKEMRPEWRWILSDINRVRLNARRRRQKRNRS